MITSFNVLAVLMAGPVSSYSQTDSVRTLAEVVIHAYEYNRPSLEVPAAVDLITTNDLERFSDASVVTAANMIPGVRMEERSPGSYRFSMRGSSLRAPFGIRNIKFYWNGLPLTDAGGNTYLNQIEPSLIREMEIIKGPGSSLYGAGTGGVVLLNGTRAKAGEDDIEMKATLGSFGLGMFGVNLRSGTGVSNQSFAITHQQSEGYREHTRLRRDGLNWNGGFDVNEKQHITATVMYNDLAYETPGGLNETEFTSDPQQARPNADVNDASVRLRSLYSGISQRWLFADRWENMTGVFGNGIRFENPSFRNVEHRSELHGGIRSVTRYHQGAWTVNLGGEFESSYIPSRTFDNVGGKPGPLQYDDELSADALLLFAQAEWEISKVLMVTGGISHNQIIYHFLHLPDAIPQVRRKSYRPVYAPRLALLARLTGNLSAYASASEGFSPPSYAEVYPSEGTFNAALNAERGMSLEAGLKGTLADTRLDLTMSAYRLALDETIVIRHASDGAEYFVNAGATAQNGLELMVSWHEQRAALNYRVTLSGTLNDFSFENYVKDSTSYSGKKLPGVPDHNLALMADLLIPKGWYARATLQYTSALPLNDANTVSAGPYTLLSLKTGFHFFAHRQAELFVGADNLLDEVYSLGNDLNAFGGRYYNPAPGRSFYGGLLYRLSISRHP